MSVRQQGQRFVACHQGTTWILTLAHLHFFFLLFPPDIMFMLADFCLITNQQRVTHPFHINTKAESTRVPIFLAQAQEDGIFNLHNKATTAQLFLQTRHQTSESLNKSAQTNSQSHSEEIAQTKQLAIT